MDAIRELHIEAKGTPLSTEWARDRMLNCERCGEATSNPICQACKMRGWISDLND
jgi:tRNA(Ile)-lysidine synthase TilS/MesJ